MLFSWPHRSRFHDIKNLKAMYSTSKHCVIEMGLHCQGQKRTVLKLWEVFFSDPSQWWDHRSDKRNARHPDFKHKKTQEALWLDGNSNPPWVEEELAAMAPGTVKASIFSWNARLAKYAKSGQYRKVLEIFKQIQKQGITPNKFTLVPVLNACASLRALDDGRRIHAWIPESGCGSDVYVETSLVGMYAKCGCINEAERIFGKMSRHPVASWNVMIMGYVKSGLGQRALQLCQQMRKEGVEQDHVTLIGFLNACASTQSLQVGKQVHEQIVQRGCESDVFVGSSLVDMYAKCGSIEDAWNVFSKMPTRNAVTWSAMIQGFVKCGQGQRALELSCQMQEEGVEADAFTFVGFLNACASVGALEEGKRYHEQILKKGYDSNVFVGSSLVDMYAKCESIEDAWTVFNKMPTRNLVVWSAMIQGCVKCGQGHKALELYQKMQQEGIEPGSFTFVGVVNACATAGSLEEGKRVHEQIIERGLESDIIIGSSLVDMYAKCASIADAQRVFEKMPMHNVVSWSAMIQGYANCGEGWKALKFYQQMQLEGVEPNAWTFVGVLNACGSVDALEEGRCAHKQIIQKGLESDSFIVSSLVDMYAKCQSIDDAWRVFKKMPTHHVVSWNALIHGHVKCGEEQKALELFGLMKHEGVEPDYVTFVGLLNACASLAALEEGKRIHQEIIQNCLETNMLVANSLIDMYAKSGSIEDAWTVFNMMVTRNVVSWNAMIGGLVKFGEGQKALQLRHQMRREEVEPDHVTFVRLLNACASVTALDEGKHVHEQIIEGGWEYDAFVGSSLVDMYAKCGSLEDARKVFSKLPIQSVVSWNIMLRGYAMHGHAEEALKHFKQMHQEGVEIDNITFVALLSACSHAGLVDEGLQFFESRSSVFNISATMEIYACLVDLLGRAGRLHEAEGLIQMTCKPDSSMWMSLLGGCRVHGNMEMGEVSARQVLELNPKDSAAYVLLSNIYTAQGREENPRPNRS